jgi:hypothetical protein
VHTVRPLAKDLGLEVDKRFNVHQEEALVAAALSAASVVLICWHHERIDKIARLLGVTTTGPWPDPVFDMVWVFDRTPSGWRFARVHQHLLPGDA